MPIIVCYLQCYSCQAVRSRLSNFFSFGGFFFGVETGGTDVPPVIIAGMLAWRCRFCGHYVFFLGQGGEREHGVWAFWLSLFDLC